MEESEGGEGEGNGEENGGEEGGRIFEEEGEKRLQRCRLFLSRELAYCWYLGAKSVFVLGENSGGYSDDLMG